MRYTPDSSRLSPWPLTVFVLMKIVVGDYQNEEVLHWVLGQGGHAAGVLVVGMADVQAVVVNITMEGVQSAANETADEKKK